MTTEEIVTELVVNGGSARGKALEAIDAAMEFDFERAQHYLDECNAFLKQAHACQTDLIQNEIANKSTTDISLILIHGQDHLMAAITTKDIAERNIKMCRKLFEREEG